MDKLIEHYGVLLDESVIRRITLTHAERIHATQAYEEAWPTVAGTAQIIVEMDGSMVPIVEPNAGQPDRRKGKHLRWKEAKLALAHPQDSKTLSYGGTLTGDVQEAGRILFDTACRSGFGCHSQVHAVGDGAPWIAQQVEARFGQNGRYLVDFYHVCDYLSAAASAIVSTEKVAKAWMGIQKERLKQGEPKAVLEALQPYIEGTDVADDEAPVRACSRYLGGRLKQLHYDEALHRKLPIGSGEIESAHRYVIQARLKRAGAWWRMDNAEHMLALRINRANHLWHDYWADSLPMPA